MFALFPPELLALLPLSTSSISCSISCSTSLFSDSLFDIYFILCLILCFTTTTHVFYALFNFLFYFIVDRTLFYFHVIKCFILCFTATAQVLRLLVLNDNNGNVSVNQTHHYQIAVYPFDQFYKKDFLTIWNKITRNFLEKNRVSNDIFLNSKHYS
jgi:hypothetical protein